MDLIPICMGGVVAVYRTVRDTGLAEMTEKERSDKIEDGQVPPPSYYETVGHDRPLMSEAGPVEVAVERPALVLGEERVEVTCRACSKRVRLSFDHNCNPPPNSPQVLTNVKDEIKPEGWIFAICCFFCGSWCASCLVCCLPGFKKFSHYCPSCGSVVTKPDDLFS